MFPQTAPTSWSDQSLQFLMKERTKVKRALWKMLAFSSLSVLSSSHLTQNNNNTRKLKMLGLNMFFEKTVKMKTESSSMQSLSQVYHLLIFWTAFNFACVSCLHVIVPHKFYQFFLVVRNMLFSCFHCRCQTAYKCSTAALW